MKRGLDYLGSDTKRRFDLTVGTGLAAVAMPAIVVVGAGAAIDTKSLDPLYTEARVGKGGEEFTLLKFRTLASTALSTERYGTFDPRASSWGLWLRRSALDELPQLGNVLDGSMSLVGPRPMNTADLERMESAAPDLFDEWFAYYKATRPGLAGPSQILRKHFKNGTTPELYRRSVELDLRYFDTASLLTDVRILARTAPDLIFSNIHVVDNAALPAQPGQALAIQETQS